MRFDRAAARKRRPQAVSREMILSAIPVRNPACDWQQVSGEEVRITLHRREDWRGRLVAVFFPAAETRKVQLDEIGSAIWAMCDGENSVSVISRVLSEKYGLERKEAEVSLLAYLNILLRKRMVALMAREQASGDGSGGGTVEGGGAAGHLRRDEHHGK